ncbi:MAG: LysM peptidoglycan-binding domain-containing protein [Pyrinomonadaceae bacterium]
MKHNNYKTESVPSPGKSQNEDFHFEWATSKGHVFIVLDFANFSYPSLNLTLQRTLEEIVYALDKLPGLSVQSFLGHLAKELNNFVFTFGRDNCDGKLFCVTAIALLHGADLYFLTYGDSRINIFTDDQLLLLNGAKYQTRSLISNTQDNPPAIRENPEQMGRNVIELPLNDRVHNFGLKDDDVVLIFSDGLEENVTPQRRLAELRNLGRSDPHAICDALINSSEPSDDRTITVIGGPYASLSTSIDEQINSAVAKIDRSIKQLEEQDDRHADRNSEFHRALSSMQENQNNYASKSELADLKGQLTSKVDQSAIDSLQLELQTVQTAGSKTKNSSKQSPQFLVIEPAALASLLQKATNEKTVSDVSQDNSNEVSATSNRTLSPGGATVVTPDHERDRFRMLGHPKVVAFAIFVFGALSLWLVQNAYNWLWPERWSAQTQGELLMVRRVNSSGSGPTLKLRLAPPTPSVNREVGSFDELVPLLDQSERLRNASSTAPLTTGNENSAASPEIVESVQAKKGDSVALLAQRYKTTTAKLEELNPNINWKTLKQGQTIRVPIANVDTGDSQK